MSVIIYFFIVFCQLKIYHVFADTWPHYNLCRSDLEEIVLEEFGEAPAATVHLWPNHLQRGQCKLKIVAPSTHVIYMQWVDYNNEHRRNYIDDRSTSHQICPLSVYLSENKKTAVWKGDPCSRGKLPDVDLLTHQVRIMWTPPRWGNRTRSRALVLTAVGKGNVCKNQGQHTCMKIGWDPILCISEHLLCDGTVNCPKGSPANDESDEICQNPNLRRHQTSWEKIAVELIKKIKPTNNGFVIAKKWGHEDKNNDEIETTLVPLLTGWKVPEISTKRPKSETTTSTDSVSAALSHYGPWGYLMLGMLICGTVLMFCGLWECCFRRPKPSNDSPNNNHQQPTTVLILNTPNGESGTIPQPPNYDDLDQPPSYAVLFPNKNLRLGSERTIICENGACASDSSECVGESVTPVIEGSRETTPTTTVG